MNYDYANNIMDIISKYMLLKQVPSRKLPRRCCDILRAYDRHAQCHLGDYGEPKLKDSYYVLINRKHY